MVRASSRAAPRRYRFRRATLRDLDLLVDHRLQMFRDLHESTEAELRRHGHRYRRWIRPLLRRATFVAIVAEGADHRPAASGCLWFQPSQPRVLMPQLETPYILSMYTAPGDRRRGLASQIVRRLIAEARRRGYPRITLHASSQGKPVYERLGFEPTSEMRLWLDHRLARRWKHPARTTGTRAGN